MRVLFTIHTRLDPNQGAPGATLKLGNALESLGWEAEYYSFDTAFPGTETDSIGQAVRFPWRVRDYLRQNAARFDVVDATTGDAWVWASRRRPGAKQPSVLVTRSHGLEHTMDRALREWAVASGKPLSWKYPLYHGGYRLWEVARSLRNADACVLLNQADKQYAVEQLKVPESRIAIIPNGIADAFFAVPDPVSSAEKRLHLAFVGSWIERKGTGVLVKAVETLHAGGLDFHLTLYGTGGGEEAVRSAFSGAVQPRLTVVPRYVNDELPRLLAKNEILLFPSLMEGFSLALTEGMACGLVPVATPVGGSEDLIQSGQNGILVPVRDSGAVADAVQKLSEDRERLLRMRCAAKVKASVYRWRTIAERTAVLYTRLLTDKAGRKESQG